MEAAQGGALLADARAGGCDRDGEVRDWVALRVPADARDLLLVFDPQPGQLTSPRRYLALE